MVLWGWSQVSVRQRISLFQFGTRTFSRYHILFRRRLRQFNCEIFNDHRGGNLGVDGACTNGGARGLREVFRIVFGDAWLRESEKSIAGKDAINFVL